MTFSLLARDRDSGTLGAVAATGSLCVGGWVLRGASHLGLSASQGALPSTMWGEDALAMLQDGLTANGALEKLTAKDPGREWRQLSVLDIAGNTAAHTGSENTRWRGDIADTGLVVAGNLLAGQQVIEALRDTYRATSAMMAERLLAALVAAENAGGDTRGLQSAALLVLADDMPPLSLRIDCSQTPVADLQALYRRSCDGEYAAWLADVPTRKNPGKPHG